MFKFTDLKSADILDEVLSKGAVVVHRLTNRGVQYQKALITNVTGLSEQSINEIAEANKKAVEAAKTNKEG